MRLLLLTMTGAALFAAAPAYAQIDPGASADLGAGYGATALGSATMDGTRAIGDGKHHSDELSPTMQKYCERWPDEGVCRADRARHPNRVYRRTPRPEDAPGYLSPTMQEYCARWPDEDTCREARAARARGY
ncbi:MAG TPA: hypothetical protein VM657_12875 [Sphingomonas sp.]|nr:hypothetical protein [Sphingomonas sp.]